VNNLESSQRAAALLGVLANESRIHILSLLLQREWDVSSLARELKMSQSALSQHLKKMRDLELVSTRRVAQTVYYSCQHEGVAKVLAALEAIYRVRATAA